MVASLNWFVLDTVDLEGGICLHTESSLLLLVMGMAMSIAVCLKKLRDYQVHFVQSKQKLQKMKAF